jgi:hypothetical protein
VLLVLLLIVAAWTLAGQLGRGEGGEPSATNFYPLFGSHGVSLNEPYVTGSLERSPSGRELPSISLVDAEGARPVVARLRITDRRDVDPQLNFVPVAINGRDGWLLAGEDTLTNYATGKEEELNWVSSTLIWPIAGGLWAVLETTLRPAENPAEATRRIAEDVTFLDEAQWTARFRPGPTATTSTTFDLFETTTSDIPVGGQGQSEGTAVSTTAGS